MVIVIWAKDRKTGKAATATLPAARATMKDAIKLARSIYPRRNWKLTFVQVVGQFDDRWINEYLPLKVVNQRKAMLLPPPC